MSNGGTSASSESSSPVLPTRMAENVNSNVNGSDKTGGKPEEDAAKREARAKEGAQLVRDLLDAEKREEALQKLSGIRDEIPNMHLLLWNTEGAVMALVMEIMDVYPYLTNRQKAPNVTRPVNALVLLQTLASNEETQMKLMESGIPFMLYPFLQHTHKMKFLRVVSLGVIGALVKPENSAIIKMFLGTDLLPLCLDNMRMDKEDVTKVVATFILERILEDPYGSETVCGKLELFDNIVNTLKGMIEQKGTSSRLVKHIFHCFLFLSAKCANNSNEQLRTILVDRFRAADVLVHQKPELLEQEPIKKFYNDIHANLGSSQPTQPSVSFVPFQPFFPFSSFTQQYMPEPSSYSGAR